MRLRSTVLPLLLGAFVLSPATARAERIYLKNGRDIDGWIVEESKANIIVAIIKAGTVGKLQIDPAEVEHIDRTRRESLQEALERYKREMAAAEAARVSAAVVTGTAKPGETAEAQAAGGDVKGVKKAPSGPVIPEATSEEKDRIQAAIDGIGDTRTHGAAVTKRDNSKNALVEFGPVAIPAINLALGDMNWYRRKYAALALAGIAVNEKRLKAYEDSVPILLRTLADTNYQVRPAANQALEAISGKTMGFTEPTSDEVSANDRAVIERWRSWWDAARADLESQR